MIELKVDFFASSVCIKSAIWNNNLNRFSICDMIFDTGASMTTISTKIARRAGYCITDAEDIYVSGIGNARIPAKRIIVANFMLAETELGPISADVVEFPEESNISAVLGMNVIKEFKVIADFKDKRPKPDKRDATIFLEPAFNVNSIPAFENFIPSESRFGIWTVKETLPNSFNSSSAL